MSKVETSSIARERCLALVNNAGAKTQAGEHAHPKNAPQAISAVYSGVPRTS